MRYQIVYMCKTYWLQRHIFSVRVIITVYYANKIFSAGGVFLDLWNGRNIMCKLCVGLYSFFRSFIKNQISTTYILQDGVRNTVRKISARNSLMIFDWLFSYFIWGSNGFYLHKRTLHIPFICILYKYTCYQVFKILIDQCNIYDYSYMSIIKWPTNVTVTATNITIQLGCQTSPLHLLQKTRSPHNRRNTYKQFVHF